MPPVTPDWTAPGFSGIQVLTSWVLAFGLGVAFIALIVCGVLIAAKGFGNQAAQQFGSKFVLWAFLGVTFLGSISAIFQLVVSFDWGL